MSKISWPMKYTNEDVINGIDWIERLGEDTIDTVEFIVRRGDVTISNEDSLGSRTFATFSGGVEGITEVLCRVVTGTQLVWEEVAEFWIRESLP